MRKITKQQCLAWGASYSTGPINFNKTVQTLRNVIDIAVEADIRYDNPAAAIKALKVRQKPLQLPNKAQFQEIVASVRRVNRRYSNDAADLIEFLAYGGFRRGEAQNIRWSDCDLEKHPVQNRANPAVESEALTHATAHVFERASVVAEHNLLAAALAHRLGEVRLPRLRQALGQSQELVQTDRGFSTRHILETELFLIRTVNAGRDRVAPLHTAYQPADWLTDDQQRSAVFSLMIRICCAGGLASQAPGQRRSRSWQEPRAVDLTYFDACCSGASGFAPWYG